MAPLVDLSYDIDRILEKIFNAALSAEEVVQLGEQFIEDFKSSLYGTNWEELNYSDHGE